MEDILLTTEKAATRLGLSPSTLMKKRNTGHDPIPYLKLGRSVRYRPADLEAWASAHSQTSTGKR